MTPDAETFDSFGAELQRIRRERGLSQPQLATKVYASRSLVSLWEIGRRTPSLDQVKELDRALGVDGRLVEIATGASGLSFNPEWRESLRTVTNMWKHDASRRAVIRGAAFSAVALANPLAQWAEHTAEQPSGTGTRRIGTPEVETIRTVAAAFRSLDNRHGGMTSRDGVVAFLDTEVAPLLHDGQFTSTVAPKLLSCTAEITQLAGWMSYDSGMHGAAERYFIQALRLAEAAGDIPLGVEILAGMAHQAAFLGHGTEAVQLAEAAMRAAADCGAAALAAEAAVMAAHGYAVAGEPAQCARLLLVAEQTLDRAERDADPQWLGYFDEAYLSAKRGHCLLAVGDNLGAIDAARRSLDMNGAYVRGKMFNLSLLATSLAAAGDPDEAVEHGRAALGLTDVLRSARADDYLQRFTTRVGEYDTESVRQWSTLVGTVEEHSL